MKKLIAPVLIVLAMAMLPACTKKTTYTCSCIDISENKEVFNTSSTMRDDMQLRCAEAEREYGAAIGDVYCKVDSKR